MYADGRRRKMPFAYVPFFMFISRLGVPVWGFIRIAISTLLYKIVIYRIKKTGRDA